MNQLFLSFPQWQGAGYNHELYHGAESLIEALNNKYDFEGVEVAAPRGLKVQNQIKGYGDLVNQLQKASELIAKIDPDEIWTIGGDCGTELAPINHINRQHNGEIAVLWIDAHADLNTPQSSPSKEFHGMPLRTLLGHGDEKILGFIDRPLHANQVFLLGVRDLDEPESDFITQNKIKNYSVRDLRTRLTQIADSIRKEGFDKIYLHVDLDVLDPSELSSVKCPTPGGLTVNELINIISYFKESFSTLGGNTLEYTHQQTKDLEKVVSIVNTLFEY